jgi:hypothetical protein
VSRTVVIDLGDVRYLQPTEEDVLTLVTCFPFGYGPRSRSATWCAQRPRRPEALTP